MECAPVLVKTACGWVCACELEFPQLILYPLMLVLVFCFTQPSVLRCLCFENARDFSISTPSSRGPCWLTVNAGHNTNDDKQLLLLCGDIMLLLLGIQHSHLCRCEWCFVCWRWQLFSVFRGSYKITDLWNHYNLMQVTRLLSRTVALPLLSGYL